MQGNWKELGTHGTLGLEMVLGVILPCYVGSLADRRWDTGSTFLIVGFVLGLAHAVRAVARAMKRTQREAHAENERRKQARKKYHDDHK